MPLTSAVAGWSSSQQSTSPWHSLSSPACRSTAATGQQQQAATGVTIVISTAEFSCPVLESEQVNTVLSSNDNEMNYKY
uniref:Uncharacterized protein n=1 Tax=Oryza meridionalis TaxID=40149 RepID=A0A0E0CK06_9ORYZ